MCGFVGIIATGSKSYGSLPTEATHAVRLGTSKLQLRGPDAEGFYNDSLASLGHRRLKVQDLSDNANQPFQLRTGGPVIVFNGEIYNFIELKEKLISQGHIFRTRSDTEVLLLLHEVYGVDCLQMLNGIFAFAIWCPLTKSLFIARDRLGVKPLYVAYCEWGIAFASEKQAIRHIKGIDVSLNEQAMVEYVWFGNTFGNRSFYNGIEALLPGYCMLSSPTDEVRRQYWSPEQIVGCNDHWYANDPHKRLRETLDRCVKRQLVSDLPVGLLLSGGIDSASVASSATLQGQNLIAINCEFTERMTNSERIKAQAIASFLGIPLKCIKISGGDVKKALYLLARHHGEPFGDAANISLYMLYQSVRDEARVILQGDGGDELFGGYNRHRLIKLRQILKAASFLFFYWKGVIPKRYSDSQSVRRMDRIMSAFSHSDHKRLGLLMTLETTKRPPSRIFQRDYQEHLKTNTYPFQVYKEASDRFCQFDEEVALFLTDLTVQLPSQFLTKVDRASMAASVEARVPLLDDELVSFTLGLKQSNRTSLMKSKKFLYESQSSRLPNEVLRSRKQGFGTPYGEWLRGDLKGFTAEHILNSSFISRFNLNRGVVEMIITDHNKGVSDNGFLIWKILQMAVWAQVEMQ